MKIGKDIFKDPDVLILGPILIVSFIFAQLAYLVAETGRGWGNLLASAPLVAMGIFSLSFIILLIASEAIPAKSRLWAYSILALGLAAYQFV